MLHPGSREVTRKSRLGRRESASGGKVAARYGTENKPVRARGRASLHAARALDEAGGAGGGRALAPACSARPPPGPAARACFKGSGALLP
uniref:Uncharacterized protein n=1 Tax=uncultured prokaryote TaxID=198431 RepID=A0A0H5Q598_9ZZZZ|nr:hypothetical protein [uncultured prokaryote]